MYGPPNMGMYIREETNSVVFNFNSLKEGFVELDLLPPNNLGAVNEYDFDIKYMQYIFSTPEKFIQFMAPIQTLYTGRDVFIVCDDNTSNNYWKDNLIESYLKMIQTRYGIIPCNVVYAEDYLSAEETDINRGYGIINYDTDIRTYLNYCESMPEIQNMRQAYGAMETC